MPQDTSRDNDPSVNGLHALRRIIRALDVYSRKLYRECHITSPQILCLRNLSGTTPQTLSSLASQLHLSVSTVNGIVDRLESRGLLHRSRSMEDQRKVMIGITPAGQNLLNTVPELMHDQFAQAFRKMADQDQCTLSELLEKLAGHLDMPVDDPGSNPEISYPSHAIITNSGTDYQLH